MQEQSTTSRVVVPLAIVAIVAALFAASASRDADDVGSDPLVVYCAHDAVFSEAILKRFERETGIRLRIRFDEEANKSLGLVNQIVAERENPRCDVFWNNQLLNTMQLQHAGLLQPYRGLGYQRMPARWRDPDGHWTGFAARLRVMIVNTGLMECSDEAIRRKLAGPLQDVAIAKPLFGTTLSHYAVLWHAIGPDATRRWHRDLRQRGIREVQGNATVRNLVADGLCAMGFTDTDDFFGAVDRGQPVEMRPVRIPSGETICIPNTVAIIRGTKHLQQAQRLVDYLLSADVELALAGSAARQIPLGTVDLTQLPRDVRRLSDWAEDAYPLQQAAAAQRECLQWLKSEYLR